jgi:hypothetical protein
LQQCAGVSWNALGEEQIVERKPIGVEPRAQPGLPLLWYAPRIAGKEVVSFEALDPTSLHPGFVGDGLGDTQSMRIASRHVVPAGACATPFAPKTGLSSSARTLHEAARPSWP